MHTAHRLLTDLGRPAWNPSALAFWQC